MEVATHSACPGAAAVACFLSLSLSLLQIGPVVSQATLQLVT